MVKIIAGLMGSSAASGSTKLSNPDQLRPLLQTLSKHHVTELDTARVYNAGKSEEDLGNTPEAKDMFQIATKAPGFSPGSLEFQRIIDNCNASLAALKQDRISLFYWHGPDRQTPLEESCRATNQLYKDGKILQFGVSNFNRGEVEEIYAICKRNDWLLPTVYQGGFNPLARAAETELFPTLRRLGMAFYAYSPLAGGFFSRPIEELRVPPAGGRYDQMKVFSSIYINDLSLQLHEKVTAACRENRLTLRDATLRFLLHHSALRDSDGVILGASSQTQMGDNLTACEKGPLPPSVVVAFEDLWTEYRTAGYSATYCV